MGDETKCCAATPAATLEQHITDSTVAKNDAEWWAHHEITRLREENARLREALKRIELGCSFPEDDVQRTIRDVARAAIRETSK